MLDECPYCGCPELEVSARRRALGRDYVQARCVHCGRVNKSALGSVTVRPQITQNAKAPDPPPACAKSAQSAGDVNRCYYKFVDPPPVCPDCAQVGKVYCTRRANHVRYLRCAAGHTWKQAAGTTYQIVQTVK